MDTVIQSDIFFFISSIGFVIFFILLAIALVYLIRLFRSVSRMAAKVEGNIESISDEAKEMIIDFRDSPIMGFIFGRKRRRPSKAKER